MSCYALSQQSLMQQQQRSESSGAVCGSTVLRPSAAAMHQLQPGPSGSCGGAGDNVKRPIGSMGPPPERPPVSHQQRTALPISSTIMREVLGPSTFNSIRALMLRQQATYQQQVAEVHKLTQVIYPPAFFHA